MNFFTKTDTGIVVEKNTYGKYQITVAGAVPAKDGRRGRKAVFLPLRGDVEVRETRIGMIIEKGSLDKSGRFPKIVPATGSDLDENRAVVLFRAYGFANASLDWQFTHEGGEPFAEGDEAISDMLGCAFGTNRADQRQFADILVELRRGEALVVTSTPRRGGEDKVVCEVTLGADMVPQVTQVDTIDRSRKTNRPRR